MVGKGLINFKYLLFVLVFLFIPNVFAKEINVNQYVSTTLDGTKNQYKATEIYNTGTEHTYTLNTRYNGTLSKIDYYIHYPFESGYTYIITMNMATNDWRNRFMGVFVTDAEHDESTNLSNHNVTFISRQKIRFTFTATQNMTDIKVVLYSTSVTDTAFTGETNWNLSSIILDDPFYGSSSSSSGSSSSSSSSSTDSTNKDIIDNSNQNTQDIINNNNQNANDIIDNVNENVANVVDTIINSKYNCEVNLLNFSGIYTNASFRSNSSYTLRYNSLQIDYDTSESGGALVIPISNFQKNTNYVLTFNTNTYTDINIIARVRSASNGGDWISEQSNSFYVVYGEQTIKFNSGDYSNGYLWIYILGTGSGSFTINNLKVYNPSYCVLTSDEQKLAIDEVANSVTNGAQSILDNANNNTQEIIDNQNENSQKQIDSQKVCKSYFIDKSSVIQNGYLSSDGNLNGSSRQGITDYIEIGTSITLLNRLNNGTYNCFYNSAKVLVSCFSNTSVSNNESIPIPSNAKYIRFSIDQVSNLPRFDIQTCKDGNQAISDSLTDDNIDSGTGSDFFNSFSDTDNGGISTIITKPLVLINSLLDNNNSCADLPLNINFNGLATSNVSLPSGCVLWNNVPETIITLYQTFVVGFCSYYLIKRLFNDIQSLKNPDDDRVEVTDL